MALPRSDCSWRRPGAADRRSPRRRRRGPRRCCVRRHLGADELRAADVALPRRGALDRVRGRDAREPARHRRRDAHLVVSLDQGPLGVLVGNFIGTLCVYFGLLLYRREQLGLRSTASSSAQMNHFGMPLVPAALALWASTSPTACSSRSSRPGEVGVYAIGVRIVVGDGVPAHRLPHRLARVRVLDRGRPRGKADVPYVLTTLVFVTSWLALAFGLLSPWIVHVLARNPRSGRAPRRSRCSRSAALVHGVHGHGDRLGRARKTQLNWVITGLAAIVNFALSWR